MGILVRATVNLPGLAAGHQAMVDPARYTIARLIKAQYLVPIESWESDAQTDTPAANQEDKQRDASSDAEADVGGGTEVPNVLL